MFHDEVGGALPSIEVEPLVLADQGTVEFLQCDEILAQVANVLFFNIDFFDGVEFLGVEVEAFVDAGVASFTDFIKNLEILQE